MSWSPCWRRASSRSLPAAATRRRRRRRRPPTVAATEPRRHRAGDDRAADHRRRRRSPRRRRSTTTTTTTTTTVPPTTLPPTTVETTTTVAAVPVAGQPNPACIVGVVAGDSLNLIVERIADPADRCRRRRQENGIADANVISVGQQLDVCPGNGIDDLTGGPRVPPTTLPPAHRRHPTRRRRHPCPSTPWRPGCPPSSRSSTSCSVPTACGPSPSTATPAG